MNDGLRKTWTEFVRPLLRRPRPLQVAAICCRKKKGETQVLLITSRGSGRWVVPKGWPIDGLMSPDIALAEAWQEAGVKGKTAANKPIGSFEYKKVFKGGYHAPVKAHVYKVRVKGLEDTYPEVKERRRKWFSPKEAANLVQEPELQDILRKL